MTKRVGSPLVAILAATALSACAVASDVPVLSQVPIESATIAAADYQRLASCSYQRLDKISGAGLKKVDLPNESTSRLAFEPRGLRAWELIFVQTGPGQVRVDFTKVQTIWGPVGYNDVMQEVRACV